MLRRLRGFAPLLAKTLLPGQNPRAMTLEQAKNLVGESLARMNQLYRDTVFDEWAIVRFREGKGLLLSYSGPRKQDFQENFLRDAGSLRAGLFGKNHPPGEFEFTRQSVGTGFESFLALGDGTYLILNNTVRSMDEIARNPLWISAQVPFAELSEAVREDPL